MTQTVDNNVIDFHGKKRLVSDFVEMTVCFDPVIVHPQERVALQLQLDGVFRGSHLVIPINVGLKFTMDDLRVGHASQAISANPIPAPAFSERAVGTELGLDTADNDHPITLVVSNITKIEDAIFVAYLKGFGGCSCVKPYPLICNCSNTVTKVIERGPSAWKDFG